MVPLLSSKSSGFCSEAMDDPRQSKTNEIHQKRIVEPKQFISVWSGGGRELDSFVQFIVMMMMPIAYLFTKRIRPISRGQILHFPSISPSFSFSLHVTLFFVLGQITLDYFPKMMFL